MTSVNTTEPRIIGSLREEDGLGVVRVEDHYPTDIHDLWDAVASPQRLARWLATVDGDTTVGQTFALRFTSQWQGTGRVDVCDAPRRLVVTTTDESGDTIIEATLVSEGEGTRLVIEERGLPLEEYAYHGSGWQTHLEDLALALSGRETSNWADRWRELTPAYLRMLQG